ncbi:putative 2-aminoethylphosphonate ABC transporter ATP-binding protein [Noviherbaspirillum saxi]|uniref:Putative 2-aminoethylphosphonate ABC transporter ATP-binding protein n=1 Tax=Noviherbaspirillum saxi TaxID=2320863 RepID=A0A3A3FVA3_9BURK|nr:putative 2-aminoethylphosphonate ABC transporter ATP-binding protein [Noviherbaspirillum saxi]RJF98061.1 putative 2-aminoethylphosphonate ABC transporter ATP-binding protein [Noviherbaspirillum saxi]
MTKQSTYLSLQGISKSFGSFTALRSIDLDINKGEFVCFLGPSGCGKTTLLRIIAGLEAQDSGRISQAGKDISWLPPIKRDYGIVFQSYALFPNLTIHDNVAYGLVNRSQPKAKIEARVQELLTLAGLPSSGNKYPGQLSGGQQQRIALARALATSPGLLLLDEPLSALDALERVRLRGEIRQLQQRLGVTTIMVTHDQEEALSMADRIVVMNHGAIEQIGTPEDIYLKPRSPFVASFVGKINTLQGESLGGGRFRLGRMDFHCGSDAHVPAGQAVKIYLRPEDLVARKVDGAMPCHMHAQIQKIEFLGAHSYLTMALDGAESQPVVTSIPLSQLEEYGFTVGSRTAIDIVPDRARVFEAPTAARAA